MHVIIRILDLLISSLAIVLTFPAMVVIFVVLMFNTGSPIFRQQRVGKDQRLFTLMKFRTMSKEAKSVATHLVDSDLVTSSGHFLRKYKLDELPQLFNVIRGEMSLVGPRPCLPSQNEVIKLREERGVFDVLPGITGLAQINQVDMSTPSDLADIDKVMITSFSVRTYFILIFLTSMGKGGGDRITKI